MFNLIVENPINYFDNEDLMIFLTLDKYNLSVSDKLMIDKVVELKNNTLDDQKKNRIKHVHLRFKDIIDKIYEVIDETREFVLIDLIEAYSEYLHSENLLDDIEGRMRMCLSGSSFDDNLKHNIYFHLSEIRGYSFKPLEYIGLYKDKAIKSIGKVDKVIVTEVKESSLSLKTVYPVGTELSTDEYKKMVLGKKVD